MKVKRKKMRKKKEENKDLSNMKFGDEIINKLFKCKRIIKKGENIELSSKHLKKTQYKLSSFRIGVQFWSKIIIKS